MWLCSNTSLTPTNTFLIWKTNKQAQINQMSANNVSLMCWHKYMLKLCHFESRTPCKPPM